MLRRKVLLLGLLATLAPSLVIVPWAHASLGPPESYRYVIDAPSIRVIPQKGTAARIVLSRPAALEFSSLPYPNTRELPMRSLLRVLGWSPTTSRFVDPVPVASLSLSDQASRIVTLGQARMARGKLVLEVICVDGPLGRSRGPGSLFIDKPGSNSAAVIQTSTSLRLSRLARRSPAFPVQIGRSALASTQSTNVGGIP